MLLDDIAMKNKEQLDKHLLDLRRRSLINLLPTENDTLIVFKKETLGRIKKIQEWIPRFSQELS